LLLVFPLSAVEWSITSGFVPASLGGLGVGP